MTELIILSKKYESIFEKNRKQEIMRLLYLPMLMKNAEEELVWMYS